MIHVLIYRFVRLLLGEDAIADRKTEAGNPIVLLGVEVAITKHGMKSVPSEDKIQRWSDKIEEALLNNRLTSGEASKLSGQLQWSSSHQFHRVGRAMIRPIIR